MNVFIACPHCVPPMPISPFAVQGVEGQQRVTALLSATMHSKLAGLAAANLHNPVTVGFTMHNVGGLCVKDIKRLVRDQHKHQHIAQYGWAMHDVGELVLLQDCTCDSSDVGFPMHDVGGPSTTWVGCGVGDDAQRG